MAKFIIKGGKPLKGTIKPGGSKNGALAIIAATLLTDQPCQISNVPEILDVKILLEIIQKLGVKVQKEKPHQYKIQAADIKTTKLDSRLVQKLRASILLMGPLLARKGKMEMLHPGGCIIGKRPVGTHFQALEKLGVEITQDKLSYYAKSASGGKNKKLKPAQIFLDEPSVTATENTIMAAVLTPGKTTIKYAACEPHVQDLCQFLSKMGAEISGIGTQTLEICGVKKLQGAVHKIIPDNIEVGTFAAAAAATCGDVIIQNVIPENLDPILNKLKMMGVKFELGKDFLHIKPTTNLRPSRIQTAPWPGFPTDLQAPFCVLATQANGTSLVHDWMYERRLSYIDELIKMGADIILCDPHRALVNGPKKLFSAKIGSPDIRAGIALIIAALIADGQTTIENIHLIDRGYENIEKRFCKLGANIKRIE